MNGQPPDPRVARLRNLVRRELRYSLTHDGWFWSVAVPNPWPLLRSDGRVSALDRHVRERGFRRRRAAAERAMSRAERSLMRRVEKACKEVEP